MDKENEEFLVSRIHEKFPEDVFITEESTVAPVEGDKCWIIDPIDGTLNFITEKKNYAISIAYYELGNPVFGMVYDVYEDMLYLGIAGKGAYLNNEKIEISAPKNLEHSILDVNLKSSEKIKSLVNVDITELCSDSMEHRHLGCASLRLCDIAMNKIHVYISAKLAVWDYAAGNIILKECGGCCYMLKYKNERSPLSNTLVIAAQNENLLEEILKYKK